MTISTWLMILAITVGPGTSRSIGTTPTTSPSSSRVFKIASHCWINGVWYNPCPSDPPPPSPEPSPEIQLP